MATAIPLGFLDPRKEEPDISHLVTEDDAPVDNMFSERQQRLLVETLYASWSGPPPEEDGLPRKYMASANVGVFSSPHDPPIVPDVFISLDVAPRAPLTEKRNRTYLVWEHGKVPDLVIEVVSNTEGHELDTKKRRYARMGVGVYVIFDPAHHLGDTALTILELRKGRYVPSGAWFDSLDLGLVEWEGVYEGSHERWLRWARADGSLLPTAEEHAAFAREAGARAEEARARAEEATSRAQEAASRAEEAASRAVAETARADEATARADAERARADAEKARAQRMAERLRALGIDPDAP